MSANKHTPRAIQLYFVHHECDAFAQEEYPNEDYRDHPPLRWSPLRTLAMWEALDDATRALWIDYARKVALFMGDGS